MHSSSYNAFLQLSKHIEASNEALCNNSYEHFLKFYVFQVSFTQIINGYFFATGAIIWLLQCQ